MPRPADRGFPLHRPASFSTIIPPAARRLAKYRINPGNVGFKEKKDKQFASIVELAAKHGKAVRIGANWGSLDQELLNYLLDLNHASDRPLDRAP